MKMTCINCKENKILQLFEEFIISKEPTDYDVVNEIFNHFSQKAVNIPYCYSCLRQISAGERVFANDFYKEKITSYFAQKIMDSIECCPECGQGQDIQELRYTIQSIFDDEDDDPDAMFESYNTASAIEDLLNEIFCDREDEWDEFYDSIIKKIQCKCGAGSGADMDEKRDYGKFDRYSEVYTQRDIKLFNHKFYGDDLDNASDYINELAKACSLEQLRDLKNDYINNNLFAYQNVAFNKLVDVITGFYEKGMYYELGAERVVYRTRTSKYPELYDRDGLWEPPNSKAGQGRYNGVGTSLLYCSNNMDVIKKEVPLFDKDIYNIGKFVINTPRHLFPINFVFKGEYSGLIGEEVPLEEQNDCLKQQYVICNIVSAICAKIGYDGIVYSSTKDNTSVDYALFCNFEKGNDIECIDVVYEK